MPHVTTANWSTLPVDRPMAMLERRRLIGEQAMLSHVTLEQGCVVPSHSHANEQFACVLSGLLRFTIGTPGAPDHRTIDVGANEVILIPSHVPHGVVALQTTVVLDVFSPPSATTGIDRKD